jgi:hypothetical protein
VEVRQPAECSMSFFEGRPEIANAMTKKVQNFDEFRREESESVESIGRQIAEVLPTLVLPSSPSSGTLTINWMAALDYFTCREAHSLPIDARVFDHHPFFSLSPSLL